MIPAHVRIQALALIHGLVNKEGEVNYNAFAKRTGIAASTVMRICKKQDPEYTFSRKTLDVLVDAFSITMEQAMGFSAIDQEPVVKIDRGRKKKVGGFSPGTPEHTLLTGFSELSHTGRREVLKYVEEKLKLQQIESCSVCGGPMEYAGRKDLPDEYDVPVYYEAYHCPACAESDRARSIVQRLKRLDKADD